MHRKGPAPHEPIYMISVAARMVGLHPQTLRHYERIGLVEPARTPGGSRMYSQHDIERLKRITSLVEDLGVNLAGVEVILRMSKQIEELQTQINTMQRNFEREIRPIGKVAIEDHRSHRLRLPEPASNS